MLNRKNIERALAKYVAHKDESVSQLLEVYAPMLLAASDIAKHIELEAVAISEEDIEKARQGQLTLLDFYPNALSQETMIPVVQELVTVIVHHAPWAKAYEADIAALDWAGVLTDDVLVLGTQSPEAFIAAAFDRLDSTPQAEAWSKTDEYEVIASQILYPALAYALRVFLDGFASQMSQRMDNRKDDVVNFDRPLHCPVCGSAPTVASVTETVAQGNTKKLHCTACGSHWTYERMRCVCCGNQITSDLTYVHDQGDDRHRLHLCKTCQGAFPTVFAGEDLNFNADVEEWVSSGILEFYAENGYEMSEEEKANTERNIAAIKADLDYTPEVVRRNKKQNYQELKREREELEARRAQLKSMIESHDYSKDED